MSWSTSKSSTKSLSIVSLLLLSPHSFVNASIIESVYSLTLIVAFIVIVLSFMVLPINSDYLVLDLSVHWEATLPSGSFTGLQVSLRI